MTIENHKFGQIAILVLDYDPYHVEYPGQVLTKNYLYLAERLRQKYPVPSQTGLDRIVLANEVLVAKHQLDFEAIGLRFFPDWRQSPTYRELLREGLRQGTDMFVMRGSGATGGFGSWFISEYALQQVGEDQLNIINREGKIDIQPRNPLYRTQSQTT